MHKLSKGLKKKIKGKKGKDKDDDFFDPAELERYRREAREAAAAAAAAAEAAAANGDVADQEDEDAGASAAESSNPASASTDKKESEEWLKFKLLTSGVDNILQKTQEDLGRIKKTSYFQRKKETPTPSEESKSIVSAASGSEPVAQRWIGFEGRIDDDDAERERHKAEAEAAAQAPVTEAQEPEPQLAEEVPEDEPEDEDDIFDTDYVDALTSGELKLAYVPDSPTEPVADGDDPFDTSVVEKIVGPLPVIKKKRQLVSIGAAAEVLNAVVNQPVRRRTVEPPKEIQLLGGFDDDPPLPVTASSATGSAAVTPCVLPACSVAAEETAHTPALRDILAEFDVIADSDQPTVVGEEDFIVRESKPNAVAEEQPSKPTEPKLFPRPELPADEDDLEFEALAYESLAKNPLEPTQLEEESDDPFDTSAVAIVLNEPVETGKRPPPRPGAPPVRPPAPSIGTAVTSAQVIDPVQALPKLVPQDSFEALFLNDSPTEEANSATVPVEADPFDTSLIVAEIPVVSTVVPPTAETPAIGPFVDFEDQAEENDPFDTSAVDKILH